MFIVGPEESGKTTLLHSLFHHESSFLWKLPGLFSWTLETLGFWKKDCITENYLERTIGLTIHSEQLDDVQLLVFDLGGQESFYQLQAIFLDLENSFFLLAIDLTKPVKSIEDAIKCQLSIISSKIPRGMKAEAVLVGTHTDLLSVRAAADKTRICKAAVMTNTYCNLDVKRTLFLNAKEKTSDHMNELKRSCGELAQKAKSAMVNISSLTLFFCESTVTTEGIILPIYYFID